MKAYLTKTNLVLGAGLLILIAFIGAVHAILLPFVLAFVLAYILHPAGELMERHHVGRGVAAGLLTVGFCLFVLAVFLIIVPILQAQVIDFMRHIPQFSESVWHWVKRMMAYTKENITPAQWAELSDGVSGSVMSVLTALGASLSRMLSSGVAVFNLLALIVITPVVLFYVLRDWKEIKMAVNNLIPPRQAERAQSVLGEINQTLSGFIRGQALVCLLLGLFYGIGLSLVGLDFGILVGLLAGLLSFVPYFGFGTGLVLSLFLALMQGFTWGQWGGLATVFILGQILEGYILTPRLVGQRVGLHPVWVIFALLAGGALAGFIGILVAVPVAAVIGVLVRRSVRWYRQTDLFTGKGKSGS